VSFHAEVIENCFQIVNKKNRRVPYVLWPQQRVLMDLIAESPKEEGHLILKAASIGISSLFLAWGIVEIMSQPDSTMVLITHQEQLSTLLLRRAKSFISRAVRETDGFFPEVIREPKDEIELANGSLAYIGTAGSSTDIGRGNPISVLICSEIAFYKNAGQLMRAILPRARYGKKIFESTANGTGGWFHHQCRMGFNGKGKFKPIFVPWYIHPEYTEDKSKKTIKLHDKTENEKDMQQYYCLTDGQVLWRRNMVMELDDDDQFGVSGEDSFKQEYPMSWEEAFLRSGSPIFGPRVYDIVSQTVCEPDFMGDISA